METPARRAKLDTILRSILGSGNVYYQPPTSIQMKYPAIRYERNRIANTSADNLVYIQDTRYLITCIYVDPDDDLPIKVSKLPRCVHDRQYISDGLIHDAFELYF